MACNKWRIATSLGGLPRGLFVSHRIPMPETVAFQDWTERIASSEGSVNQSGYTTCVLAWAKIPRPYLLILRRIIKGLARNTQLFMTIDRNNGTKGSPEWINISGYATISDPPADAVGRKNRQSYDITISLNNVTIIGDAY